MNIRKLVIAIAVLGLVVGVAVLIMKGGNDQSHSTHEQTANANQPVSQTAPPVPAHYDPAPSLSSLGPTLPPERFVGPTQQAYMAAREIPQTLAQLPCYCHCDRGMGHKSLHSCFEDEHASHCAVCVEEALLAYRLQKEQKLPADQIRQKIIEKYGEL
ncbi:MAG TPA: CYCXC family (seleno)protein [Pyrinomonadaceae bacterium]|nr:CYCXC family (seleno)protein [Pyrinomonadaceae bacterium]